MSLAITTKTPQFVNSAAVAPSAPSAPAAPAAQTSSDSSVAAATAVAPLYSSPVQTFDPSTGAVVVETRNTSTGVIDAQTPGTAALQYQRSQMLAAQKAATEGAPAKES